MREIIGSRYLGITELISRINEEFSKYGRGLLNEVNHNCRFSNEVIIDDYALL